LVFSVTATIIGVGYLSKANAIQILENEINAAEQQSRVLARMAEQAYESGVSEEKIAEGIQTAIENSDTGISYLCVFDWSEKLVSHPDVTLIGDKQDHSSGMKLILKQAPAGEELYYQMMSFEETNAETTEIFYIAPIEDPSWIIAAHLNVAKVKLEMTSWKNQAYLTFSIIMLLIVLIVMGTVRLITSYYEAQLSLKSSQLEDGVLNLSKLNDSLENYQSKLGELTSLKAMETPPAEMPKEKEKQRILTYVRNELMPVATEDIGYIYVENTITYVVQKDGKRSTTSESLDQIYSYLDERSFFRANRQIIVAISAIDKIIKFGNSKLKIQVTPASEIDIIIGKNKAAAFKQWLDL
jgi:DNA-binding LytR/AlgR family response regulator